MQKISLDIKKLLAPFIGTMIYVPSHINLSEFKNSYKIEECECIINSEKRYFSCNYSVEYSLNEVQEGYEVEKVIIWNLTLDYNGTHRDTNFVDIKTLQLIESAVEDYHYTYNPEEYPQHIAIRFNHTTI